ncbi:MAG: strictosidine synthase [Burkholderiales bacterium PBB6]|nr:MAG: strictosidine synthase [Burkholderiales bacterium PBB6]
MRRFWRTLFLSLCMAVLLLAAYLLLWPVPVRAVAWTAPGDSGYTGVHAANQRLAGLQVIDLHGEEGPEHIAIGPDGALYAAVLSGKVLRMAPDGSGQTVFANSGGRVLGFDFERKPDGDWTMIAADAVRGLLRITRQGEVTVLADRVGDSSIRYADAVVVSSAGKVYLSDASTRFAPKDWGGTFEASVLDILEQSATGRIIEHDLRTGQSRVVAHGLSFANGVVLSQDEQQLLVAETGRYRIWRVSTDASNLDLASVDLDAKASATPSQAKVLIDSLPGYPDNLMRGRDGRIWVGLTKPRNPVIDRMAGTPWLREVTLRLPRALWPIPKAYGHVFAFNEQGQVLLDLQDISGRYPETTAVSETPDRLYVQSLHARGLGWISTSAAGLSR